MRPGAQFMVVPRKQVVRVRPMESSVIVVQSARRLRKRLAFLAAFADEKKCSVGGFESILPPARSMVGKWESLRKFASHKQAICTFPGLKSHGSQFPDAWLLAPGS
ncbi:MAG TPA: hypothetical protein DDW52_06260, partial [Planctomycetaceae bacterium]|nr:hypothetical protein [Planctomycetaceae bacterium]